jgi:hypothetical protein
VLVLEAKKTLEKVNTFELKYSIYVYKSKGRTCECAHFLAIISSNIPFRSSTGNKASWSSTCLKAEITFIHSNPNPEREPTPIEEALKLK